MPADRPVTLPSAEPVEHDLAGALHEVSNSLTVVVGWLERAMSSAPPELRQALEIAHARARDGRDIARRAIGARTSSAPIQQTLDMFLDEAAAGVLPEAQRRGVRVLISDDTSGTPILEDARVALQIVTNLLLNAIAFSPSPGAVTLRAEADRDEISLRVSDEGPGLRPEQAFRRGQTTREGGAGIGLAHAQALAVHHGGSLLLEPSERGACFLLRWPRAPILSSSEPTRRPAISLRGRRVLLIEDDAEITGLLELAFASRGADVVAIADHAHLALPSCQGPFDILLVDWSPIADNPRAALTALHASFPDAPLIAVSGSVAPLDHAALALCSGWVRKPFDLDELLAAVIAHLPEQKKA